MAGRKSLGQNIKKKSSKYHKPKQQSIDSAIEISLMTSSDSGASSAVACSVSGSDYSASEEQLSSSPPSSIKDSLDISEDPSDCFVIDDTKCGSRSANYPPIPPLNGTNAKLHSDSEELEQAPLLVLVTTYLGYVVLIAFGHLRDFFGKMFKRDQYKHLSDAGGYAALTSDFESFYTRRLYTRIRDCWNRPITGVPGRTLNLIERTSEDFNRTFKLHRDRQREVLNLSSYNYLGFAQSNGLCARRVSKSISSNNLSLCSPRLESGTFDLISKVEKLVARFLGKPDSLIVSMGFATNSTTLPALVGKGSLIISDELNHSSLVFGSRLSGATIRIFRHNDPKSLEKVLRSAIAQGQPRTHRPWKKILIVVEGLYSMEGSICNLPEIIALKKKYKAYLYVDEAHSVGALGPRGGGVCDYFGIDPADVDILMGTFTKSFGAAGGYVAASKPIINYLRLKNHASVYAETMSPVVVEQVYSSMKIILGEDLSACAAMETKDTVKSNSILSPNTDEKTFADNGVDENGVPFGPHPLSITNKPVGDGRRRLDSIAWNSRYLRTHLRKSGFIVYGDLDSPVIPLLLFNPAKIPAFSRECLRRGLAVVVVGYPATPIISSRARFCVSAAHTREDLDEVIRIVNEVGDLLVLKHSSKAHGNLVAASA